MTTVMALFPTVEDRDRCHRALDMATGHPICHVQNCDRYTPPTAYAMIAGKKRLVQPPCTDMSACQRITNHLTPAFNSSAGRYGLQLTPEVRELGGVVLTLDGSDYEIPGGPDPGDAAWDEYEVPPLTGAPGEETWALVP